MKIENKLALWQIGALLGSLVLEFCIRRVCDLSWLVPGKSPYDDRRVN